GKLGHKLSGHLQKPRFGVDQLGDDNLETDWQLDSWLSASLTEHPIQKKNNNDKSDESYTLSKISVRVENYFHNLQETRQLEL
ncbi:Anaphase-promoting complex subunit 10, partial [Galemys pyrenaicus]